MTAATYKKRAAASKSKRARKVRSDKLTPEERKRRGTYDWSKYEDNAKRRQESKPIDTRPAVRKTSARETRKWVRNASDELACAAGCWFDERQPAFVRDWFAKYLAHAKGIFSGQPFQLQEWQYRDIIAPVFGWIRPDRTRRFRIAYIEVPKKNGKSTLSAAVGLYLLLGDGVTGSHVFSAATSRDQASIVHDEAIKMAKASPALAPQLNFNRTTRVILHEPSVSLYRVISSEAGTVEGLDAHGLIGDEFHAWYGRVTWDALEYAGRARAQPLFFLMTTAGDDLASICYEVRERALEVLSGRVEEQRLYALILTLGEDEDYHDPAVQQRINPMLGITISREEFTADIAAADAKPIKKSSMLRYGFNKWATGVNVALELEEWKPLAEAVDWEEYQLLPAYLAMDLSQSEDMSAAAIAIPSVEDRERMTLSVHFWLPEDAIEKHRLRANLRQWAEAGWLTITDGNRINYAQIEDWAIAKCEAFNVVELCYDKWYAIASAQRIQATTGVELVEFPQTLAAYAKPWSDFKKLIAQSTIRHDGNPVMAWQVGHVTEKEDDSGNARPIKPRRGDDRKVDGIIAATMACGRAMASLGPQENFYDNHEVELV
jgi:phage terminase large subunit-like protein